MRFLAAGLTVICALAACDRQKPADGGTAGDTVATADGFDVYAGRYPFDAIGDTSFQRDPRVVSGVTGAVADPTLPNTMLSEATANPIAVDANTVLSWACEPHNCGAHQWSVVLDRATAKWRVCYKPDGGQAEWFENGKVTRPAGDTCPGDLAELSKG